jgi:isoleucyl-tRNA synthetase
MNGIYDFSAIETSIYQKWIDNDIFQKSVIKNIDNDPFIFYEGPPFATGKPHYGHILAASIKDCICRNAQMKNHYVERNAGWDCHGMPIEFMVDQKLKICNRQDVLKFGIDNYNDECRKIVLTCEKDWQEVIPRSGRWLNFKEKSYRTMDLSYMNGVWGCFKKIWDKNMIYKGFKVMPYSTRCGTTISNFEAKSNYKDVKETSIIVKFKGIIHEKINNVDIYEDVNYLVWTTTPWTLSSNMALCINGNIKYAMVLLHNQKYIVAYDLVETVFKRFSPDYCIIDNMIGHELKNRKYTPIFNYFNDNTNNNDNTLFTILIDSYVSDKSGTGIVHLAPAFGEDDYRICVKNNVINKTGIDIRCPIDSNGCFTDVIFDYTGRLVKDCDADIINVLKNDNKLFDKMSICHQYPYCWRSNTPLIYKAVSSWFINVSDIKDDMIKNVANSNWISDSVKTKRFINWLEDAKDWNFSRTRYWGTPIPIWVPDEISTDEMSADEMSDEIYCIGSVDELEKMALLPKGSITDIHRDKIDHITVYSPKTGKKLKRIDEVFDCWFESGCMPFCQNGYHGNNTPIADFIAEGIDQTRGWFYTLLVISTIINNTCPFRNVIVNGLILDKYGKKMSKSDKTHNNDNEKHPNEKHPNDKHLNTENKYKRSYPEPMEIINKYSADALRLYLLGSPAVRSENLKFDSDEIKKIISGIFIPLINSYNFYIEHKVDKYIDFHNNSDNIFDQWMEDKFSLFKENILSNLNNYKLHNILNYITKYIDVFNNIYIKLNRNRINGKYNKNNIKDQINALNTLGRCLHDFAIVTSAIIPYFSEYIYQLLEINKYKSCKSNEYESCKSEEYNSVHLLSYDDCLIKKDNHLMNNANNIDFSDIDYMYEIIEVIRQLRLKTNIKNKIPIADAILCLNRPLNDLLFDIIKSDTNIINLTNEHIDNYSRIDISVNKREMGKLFKSKSTDILNALNYKEYAKINMNNATDGLTIQLNNEPIMIPDSCFNIKRLCTDNKNYELLLNNSNTILVYINIQQSSDTIARYYSGMMVKSTQNFRKDLLLKPSDNIIVNYITQSPILINAFHMNATNMKKVINYPINLTELTGNSIIKTNTNTNYYSECNVDGETYTINIIKNNIY